MQTIINEVELAKTIGKVIAQRRHAKGLTQEQVAELLGVGNEAISRMERGVVMPTVVKLILLASIFECPVDSLLHESSPLLPDQSRRFEALLEPLSEQDRRFVLGILQKMVNRLTESSQEL